MTEDRVNLILTIFRYTLVIIGVGLSILLFSGPTVQNTAEEIKDFRESTSMSAINYTIGIIITAIVVVLGFFIFQLIIQPKKTIMAIVGIVASLVIYFSIFLAGTSDTNLDLQLRKPVSDMVINMTSAGIYTIGICIIVGILAVALGPLMGRYRK